jgi:phosphatidylserine/phosphatidylglycerophosphate/cardiolipin synthase-like enzyme
VAFATDEGVRALQPGIEAVAGRGGGVRLLAGLADFLTDVSAIERASRTPGTECRVFIPKGAGEGGRFHPKLYVFEGERESIVIVGSANLSQAGLETNHEASLWLRSEPVDPRIGALGDGFQLLGDSPRAVPLSEQVRRDYEAARQARERALAEVVQLEEYRRFTAALRANVARALVRPGSRRRLIVTSPTTSKSVAPNPGQEA